MHIIVISGTLAGLILFSVNRLKVPLNLAPLFSISSVMLVMYVFTLFSHASLGAWLIIGIDFLFLADFLINFLFKNNWLSKNKEIVFGFVFFFGFIAFLGYLSRGWNFHCWDEYMHWDPIARHIYKTDELYVSGSWFIHPHYVPGMPLFGVFLTLITKYTDGILTLANNIYIFAGLFVFLYRWDSLKRVLINGLACFFSYVIIFAYTNLYINSFIGDFLVGIIFAALTFQFYIDSSMANIKKTLPIISAYVLTKDICIFFALCIIAIFLGLKLVKLKREEFNKKNLFDYHFWQPIIYLLVSVTVVFASWQIRLQLLGIPKDMSILINPVDYYVAFIAKTNGYFNNVISNMILQIFTGKVGGLFTTAQFLVIYLILSFASLCICFRFKNNRITFIYVSLLIIFFAYIFIITATFLGSETFGQVDLSTGDDFLVRYFSSFFLSCFLLLLFLSIEGIFLSPQPNRTIGIVLISFLGIYSFNQNSTRIKWNCIQTEPDYRWSEAKQNYKKFERKFPEGSKVQIINYQNDYLERLMLNDLFTGEKVTFDQNSMAFSPEEYSPDQFLATLVERNIDYVFSYRTTPEFWANFDELFEGNDKGSVFFPAIYRFDKNNRRLLLDHQ